MCCEEGIVFLDAAISVSSAQFSSPTSTIPPTRESPQRASQAQQTSNNESHAQKAYKLGIETGLDYVMGLQITPHHNHRNILRLIIDSLQSIIIKSFSLQVQIFTRIYTLATCKVDNSCEE